MVHRSSPNSCTYHVYYYQTHTRTHTRTCTHTHTRAHTHTHTHTASSFRRTLLPTSVGVELSAIFPALLPTSFSLVIYYYDRDTSDLVGKSELFDLSFSNTRTVDYLISADKMPPVLSFSVRIAVKVGGIEGDSSSSSNTISTYM